MTPEERIQKVKLIRDMAERIFAGACNTVLLLIEKKRSKRVNSHNAALQYQKGIKKFFHMNVMVDGEVIRMKT